MAQGFILGAVSGTAIAVGLGAIASVVAPMPEQPGGLEVAFRAPIRAAAPVVAAHIVPTVQADDGLTVASNIAPLGQVAAPDTLAALETSNLRPPLTPRVVAIEDVSATFALDAPEALPTRGSVQIASISPVQRSPRAAAPLVPAAMVRAASIIGSDISVRRPEAIVVRAVPGDAENAAADRSILPQVEVLQPNLSVRTTLETPVQDEIRPSVIRDTQIGREVQSIPQPAAQDAPAQVAQEAPAPNTPALANDTAPEDEIQTAQAQVPAPDAMPAPSSTAVVAAPRPQIGTPAASLTDRSTGVVVNRAGVAAAPDEASTIAASPDTPADNTAAAASDETLRPVERYRQAFENPDAKPLMSIVLIDNGLQQIGAGTSLADLRGFPYPLSFAVDSGLPDAQERIAMYRNEGFEVLGIIDLPEGALPTDAETTLGVLLPEMQEVVGILEGTAGGLQGSREVSDQVTEILAQSGHGLVAQAKGLNTMPNLARKEGVPAAPVFRDFDSKDQNERVIRRFLDQAAFKAGQQGAVIMLGRLRPETISALLVWGLQDRAGRVALSPVSAVLLADSPS